MTKTGRKVFINTLGCRVNQYDSAALMEQMKLRGYDTVPAGEPADIQIINTCIVTSKTEAQSRQAIRQALKKNPDSIIIATGCYAQKDPEELARISPSIHVLGNMEKDLITEYISQVTCRKQGSIIVSDISGQREFLTPSCSDFLNRTRAFLKIQDGCNSRCSYCIVPHVRGPNRSLEMHQVLSRLRKISQAGYMETVLTGIHLGSYGKDLDPPATLFSILNRIESSPVTEKMRIRLSSIEPGEVTDEIISLLSRSETICHHLHIPLQSADRDILQRMRRPYTPGRFKNLIDKLASGISDLNIGIDVIAGFPGESDRQFRNTMDFIEGLKIAYIHAFPYSIRPGTPASEMDGQVPDHIKKERVRLLRKLSDRKKEGFYGSNLNRVLQVVVESKRDRTSGYLKGFTSNYIPVLFEGDDSLAGRLVRVRLERVSSERVFGSALL